MQASSSPRQSMFYFILFLIFVSLY